VQSLINISKIEIEIEIVKYNREKDNSDNAISLIRKSIKREAYI